MTYWKDYCVRFFQLKFLTSTLHHILYLPKPSAIYKECDFVRSISGNKLRENILFYVFFLKKKTISNGRKIEVNSSKKCFFFFSGYYFHSYIFPATKLFQKEKKIRPFTLVSQ